MVPEGWSRVPINQAGEVVTGTTPPTAVDEYYGEGFPFVSPADLGQHRWIRRAEKSITAAGLAVSRALPAGASLFVCIGSTIGKIGQSATVLSTNQQINAVVPKAGTDADYLYYALDFRASDIARLAGNQAVPLINKSQFSGEMIPLPPLPEQQKIAEILSTWDKAIETTEALLANARTQKRALMQSLLTGSRRFPGFEDHPWREVRLGDVLREVNKPVDWSDDELYRLVSVRRRSGGVFHREDLYGHQILTKTLKHAHAGDFLISKMQVVHGAMALVTPEFDGMQISGSYISLVSKDQTKLDIRFFDWLSRTQDMYRRAYQCSYGVHIEKMTFNFGLFLKESVPMPSSVNEQITIADALDTAQAEEHWFEGEAERLRTEKKSLMQQLLTGKRRVVV